MTTDTEKPTSARVCRHRFATRPILYVDTVGGKQVCRDDLWAVTTAELNALAASMPESWESYIEFGYTAAERGVNLIAAIEDARSRLAAAPSPDEESKR